MRVPLRVTPVFCHVVQVIRKMGRTLDDAMRVLRNKTTSLQKKRRKLTGTDAPDYVFNLNRAVGHQSRRVSQAMQDIVMSATARRAHHQCITKARTFCASFALWF